MESALPKFQIRLGSSQHSRPNGGCRYHAHVLVLEVTFHVINPDLTSTPDVRLPYGRELYPKVMAKVFKRVSSSQSFFSNGLTQYVERDQYGGCCSSGTIEPEDQASTSCSHDSW